MSTKDSKAETNGVVGTLEDMRTLQSAQPPLWGQSFADLMAGADVAQGGDLLKGEDPKADLIGIPFLITRLVFRDGIKEKDGTIRNYVSAEILTADEATYNARRKFMPPNPEFPPNSSLVFNDGSTGFLREMVAYCHEKGYINVGDIPADAKTGGGMGESPFDTYRGKWVSPVSTLDVITGKTPEVTVDVRFFCPRGLRVSEYENDYTASDGAKTYYVG